MWRRVMVMLGIILSIALFLTGCGETEEDDEELAPSASAVTVVEAQRDGYAIGLPVPWFY
ncbi:MAG: hypothetical protein KatS3mg057_1060 [Herpetosiphonaceae bacterium]|nr:MAG: hypothetical protein KatS3mg057_1060 [Herpetosiphonaceae bacterium]